MANNTIYWYDFETFGIDPRRSRASQFAGIRTDEDLNIIGEPLVIYCKPANDFLPDPMACLITGISPQKALREGLPEVEFIKRIHREFSVPDTCVAGYNSIRFDDELSRQLLYRNFYDPYEREWKNGNSRWDIIDMLRLCAGTRPDGINWPRREDGGISFRLEQLTVANGIEHADAHDALADVIATIEMAKLVRRQQPKLYEHIYQLRNKKKVQAAIDWNTQKPLLHVSMMYRASHGCMALVIPLCLHPSNNNGVIVYDLREDPSTWIDLSVEEIRQRVYTPRDKLPEGVSRVPLKTLHTNKCPIITSAAVLAAEQAQLYSIDSDRCKLHWQQLQGNADIARKVAAVFDEEPQGKETDPDFMIYSGGFFSDSDRSLLQTVRATSPRDLARLDLPFRDERLPEMLFRYRARNFPETLNHDELAGWEQFRQGRVTSQSAREQYENLREEAQQRLEERGNDQKGQAVLDELQLYVASLTT